MHPSSARDLQPMCALAARFAHARDVPAGPASHPRSKQCARTSQHFICAFAHASSSGKETLPYPDNDQGPMALVSLLRDQGPGLVVFDHRLGPSRR